MMEGDVDATAGALFSLYFISHFLLYTFFRLHYSSFPFQPPDFSHSLPFSIFTKFYSPLCVPCIPCTLILHFKQSFFLCSFSSSFPLHPFIPHSLLSLSSIYHYICIFDLFFASIFSPPFLFSPSYLTLVSLHS